MIGKVGAERGGGEWREGKEFIPVPREPLACGVCFERALESVDFYLLAYIFRHYCHAMTSVCHCISSRGEWGDLAQKAQSHHTAARVINNMRFGLGGQRSGASHRQL